MSMFITRQPSRMLRAAAPEPIAARVVSSASPALTATNLPAWAANRSPIARALLRRTATPVRINAPLSICSGRTPASAYWRSTKRRSATASMLESSAYGVSSTSLSCSTVRSATM